MSMATTSRKRRPASHQGTSEKPRAIVAGSPGGKQGFHSCRSPGVGCMLAGSRNDVADGGRQTGATPGEHAAREHDRLQHHSPTGRCPCSIEISHCVDLRYRPRHPSPGNLVVCPCPSTVRGALLVCSQSLWRKRASGRKANVNQNTHQGTCSGKGGWHRPTLATSG